MGKLTAGGKIRTRKCSGKKCDAVDGLTIAVYHYSSFAFNSHGNWNDSNDSVKRKSRLNNIEGNMKIFIQCVCHGKNHSKS